MSFYRPLLPNGQIAPLRWEIRLFYFNVTWPIGDNAGKLMRWYIKIMSVVGFLMYSYMNDAELNYMTTNIKDIGLVLEGMATYLILVETHLRIYSKALTVKGTKDLMDEFYQKIYLEESLHKQEYRDIQRKLIPTKLCSYTYMLTLTTYFLIPILGLINNMRVFPFKALFRYDTYPLHAYIPSLIQSLWIGCAVVSHLVAESNLLATIILHLNARYLALQRDLKILHEKISQDMKTSSDKVLMEYRKAYVEIVKRNVVYNEFAQKFQKEYSFCIFVMMSLSAVLLCVLAFKAATLGMVSKNVTFVSWIIGKIIELLVFGTLGSQLIETTDKMTSFYYLANWEDVILSSNHTRGNIELMKLIAMSIELNQKPFCLSGFNYFAVSLITVVTILQGAGSYFTFLYAFR